MGTLHYFPKIPKTGRDPQSRNVLQTIPELVRQLKSCQKLAADSVQKLTEVTLWTALDRLKTALEDIDVIGRLLPPGELKTQFDLDRSALAAQLDLAKGMIVGLREQTDLDGHAPL